MRPGSLSSRGEKDFVRFPPFAARLYSGLSKGVSLQRQHREIAEDLVSRIEQGRLLDVGTGPGFLLREVFALNPHIELYGLDISEAMVALAREILRETPVDLQTGAIQRTDYEHGFFDLVTCTGSFYLWDRPVECLEEIHRILKPGGWAVLCESHRDIDSDAFHRALRANLCRERLLRRLVTPIFLKKQLRMTYSKEEVEEVVLQTSFRESYEITPIALANLPIWMRIELQARKC